jgi:hypothetical protein
MLSSVARAPGEGRTNVVNTLENRQAGQGRRVANALSEGFEAPETGAQVERRLTQSRDEAANSEFGAVREGANPVDLTNAIARIDETLTPGANQIVSQQSNIANDTVESALQRFRDRMTDGQSNLSDFTAVQRVRGDLSDAVQSAHSPDMETGLGFFVAYCAKLTARWKMHPKDIWRLISVLLKRRVILSRYRRAVTQQCGDGLKTRSRPMEHSRPKDRRHTAPVT